MADKFGYWPKFKGGKPMPPCGARRTKYGGVPCNLPAGFRTNHLGDGPCIFHGGCLPNIVKSLAHKRLMRQLVDQGYWDQEDIDMVEAQRERELKGRKAPRTGFTAMMGKVGTSINYFDALDALMSDTMRRTLDLKEVVDQIPLEEHDIRENRATFARFDHERKLAATIAKDAIAAEVDKRRLALDEAKADQIVRALAKAALSAELTPDQEERIRAALADELRALPSGD